MIFNFNRLAELNSSMNYVNLDVQTSMELSTLLFDQEQLYDVYFLCKSFFDGNEYQR